MADKKTGFLSLSPEAKVGLFVLIGVLLLVYMSLRVGGIRLGRAEGYTLIVKFDSAAGLDPDASVRVAGVEVGRVKTIRLEDHKAQLELIINPDVEIGKDFVAALKTTGLLGERYVELMPGRPGAPALKEGEEITRTAKFVDVDTLLMSLSDVAEDLKKVTASLGNVLGGEEGETTLRNIVKNVEDLSFTVNRIVEQNDEKLGRILANLDEFSTLLRDDGPEISAGLKEAVKNLNTALLETSNNLNSLIEDNRENLKEGVENLKVASIKLQEAMDTVNEFTKEIGPKLSGTVENVGSIAKKIDEGEGTLGKLVNDPEMHDNLNKTISGINNYIEKAESFRFFIGYRGEFLFDQREVKSYFSMRVQPKSDKYYLLEVIDDPRGNVSEETKDVTVGSTTTSTKTITTSEDIKFSVQIAKRFRAVTLRGGLIESTGGAGMDLFLFKDRLKIYFEAFDFDQEGNPHLKAGGTLHLNRFFYLTAGYDDFISRQGLESAFLGIGLQFEDNDIKYLFTSAPPISF
ncbi:MAG TPA: MlaD family protein [Thermodesulfobacteriota bacterium]|nr:MlaD family protein [Thermodesulfobacteriota bacterium]